ncbi:MAG TPA: D-aminoacylase [Syntrophobacteraceae bacterium]|nr:D-aminoacylase [Syntrophobacteraceae bacterium]
MKSICLVIAVMIIFFPAGLYSAAETDFDTVIRNGLVYDGGGSAPFEADIGIKADRIAAVGDLSGVSTGTVIDAKSLAVAPGFINMLSWSTASLIIDGRSQSELRQGVTTEILGEGKSMGPLNEEMKRRMISSQGDLKFDVCWTTLCQYLSWLEKRGISPNVASFVGAGTVREYVVGEENKRATRAQLDKMCELVGLEMEAGALGVGSSLGYAPDMFATTGELIAMCRTAAKYGGMYISHVRNEGDRLIEAVEEFLRISREAGVPAEIYHLKAGGQRNWPKIDRVISMIEEARSKGSRISADIYLYTASSNRLSSRLPAWAHEGGDEALLKRLKNPALRKKIALEMRRRGPMPKTILVGFSSESLRPFTGKTLEEVARIRGKDEIEAMLDLISEDDAHTRVAAFVMSEENIKKELRQPWVSLGSDAVSISAEGVFLKQSSHPRAYGNFARLLGTYVRDEKVISLQEAIRRITSLPAENLGLDRRGRIKPGYFADLVVFDPETIADRATYDNPHRYATGVKHVLVNGVRVIENGEHTGSKPGTALWGRGKVK